MKSQSLGNTDLEPSAMQQKFIDEYIRIGASVRDRVYQASVNAGYSQKTATVQGTRLLSKPHIIARIRVLEKKIRVIVEEELGVTKLWVLKQLVQVYQQSMLGEPEMIWNEDGKKEHSGLWTFNDRGANRALELMGREIGMFEKKDNSADKLGGFNLTIDLGSEPKKEVPKDITPVINTTEFNTPEIDLG